MDQEEREQSLFTWQILSDDILLNVFCYLPAATVIKASEVCKTWYRVAFDEFLWKNLFYSRWKIPRSIPIAAEKESWMKEYKRLYFHTPAVESEVIRSHTDEVLRVCFSHNGKMFATSSKDGFIKVWNSSYPCYLKYEADMKKFACAHTWFSQFNESDTLLLVAGVYDRNLARGGEIVVFSLTEGFRVQIQVINESDQVLGAWYNDSYFLSGILRHTSTMTSSSTIWINQTHVKTNAEHESLSKLLYRFLNDNNDCVRSIMIANVVNDTPGSLYKISCGTTGTSQCKDDESEIVHSVIADNVQASSDKNSSYPSQRSITNERSRSVDHHKTKLDPKTNNYESDFASVIDTNDRSCKKSVDLGSDKSGHTHKGYSYSFSLNGSSELKITACEIEDKMASASIFDDVLKESSSDALTEDLDLIKEEESLIYQRCFNDNQLKVPGPDSTDVESEIEGDTKMHQMETFQSHVVLKTVDKISVNAERLRLPSDSDNQKNVNLKRVCSDVSGCDKIRSNCNDLDISVTPSFDGPSCNKQSQPYSFTEDDLNDSESCKSDVAISKQSVDKNTSITTSQNDDTPLNRGADKYLIFKRGTETCIPHEVGIKLIRI
ncbi:hypothetical protein CHS0354_017531 [Potamilus streckersoni]|uniref:F-box domain-containing protein n=1 Tax=Potamilus streckersoni TaxID=2493646 RepID=A0AAE0S7B1_9BIVA|nr:hypothetical protein CHS0354_017531 [Potamilus streckersoni]